MEIKIKETTSVVPSTAPFSDNHEHRLSRIDRDPNLQVTFRYIRAYASCPTEERHPFDVICNALSSILVQYYQLAGSLVPDGKTGEYKLGCTVGQGARVINAEIDCTLESVNYLDEPQRHFIEQLVPNPGKEEGLSTPFILQVTVFKCGGFTLGTAVHHSLCDGMGASLFFTAMADLARGSGRAPVNAVWDRADLLGPRDPPQVDGPITEFLSVEKGFRPYQQQIGRVVKDCFHVENKWLDQLKKFLFDKSGGQSFTAFEALGAFIWRAKVRACQIDGNQTVKYAYSTNIRKVVKPPLPFGYWGNGCVPMYTHLSASDLKAQPIWETARLIKETKPNIRDDYVRSFVDFQELHSGKGIKSGDEVSGFTDWRHLGHEGVDFGWGSPINVFPLTSNLLGSLEPCYFLPYSPNAKKDGFKLFVNLRESALPGFRAQMERLSQGMFD